MPTPSAPTADDLRRVARDRAAAEWAEWSATVAFRDAELSRIAQLDSPMRRLMERTGIALEIGQAMGLPEGQVANRLAAADRVLDHGPRVWSAFRTGAIDAARVREISLAIDRLERTESRQRLDAQVVKYAMTHTLAELRQWLRRFVTRVESDLALERAKHERTQRRVTVEHTDDGMAWLNAYLPSHHAAAIENRLHRTTTSRDAADDRTRDQRRADLLVDLLTTHEPTDTPTPGPRCDIAVTIAAEVLTGATRGHVESTDGSWQVPAEWLLESALAGEAFWHRLLVDPFTGDTLAHQYRGYSPPDLLRRAIQFRDGVCATPGCLVPADRCELDHRVPWPEGPTCGTNLDPRCKRHHGLKGHAVLPALLHDTDQRHRHRLPTGDPSPREAAFTRFLNDH